MNDFKRRLISVLIIFFALLLAMTAETGFSLGEKLFLSLGISPWTNGRTGFYLPTIIAFPLFIIGIAEAKRVMSGRHIVIVIIALFLLIPNVLTIIKPVYFSRQSGLAAIEYDLENTKIAFKNSADEKNIEMVGTISLINHGKKPLNTSIKIPMPSEDRATWMPHDIILTEVVKVIESEVFRLAPGENTIQTNAVIPSANNFRGQGEMMGPDLILFTEDETRLIGNNL